MSQVSRASVLALMFLPLAVHAAAMRAGVASVDITPPPGLSMYGYFDRIKEDRLSTGTLDPLYARALVLEAGNSRLALVTLDLGRCFGKASLDRLRSEVRRLAGISNLLVTASHTHAGPNVLDEYPNDQLPAWEADALGKIAHAVEEASRHVVDVRLGTGYGIAHVGYNRRVLDADGGVKMLWQNPTKIPTFPVDPTVSILRLDSADEKPLAILVNYACHPVIFGSDNQKYSSDYVGVMRRTVEEGFGGRLICFFLQGADGDINPYYASTPLQDGAVKLRDWTGQELGQEVVRAAKAIQTDNLSPSSIGFAEDEMIFKVRWPAEQFRSGLLKEFGPRIFEDHADLLQDQPVPGTLTLNVATALIGKRIAIATVPAESFVEFQMTWRNRCPVPDAFFLGYTNGYFDYLPTIQAASEGGYGAADSNTYLEVGTGERLVDHALWRVYEMMGRLGEMPEDLKDRHPR